VALPLRYNFRNVVVRWRSTLATVLGLGLIVAVFVLVQSLAVGIEKSSASTGDPRNLMVTRKGAVAESSSLVTREQFRILQYLAGIARDEQDRPLVSSDVLIIINLPRAGGGGSANVLLRGIAPAGPALRPQVRLAAGRWFTPGRREAVVSQRLAARFAGMELGGKFRAVGSNEITIVGHFDGGRTAFDSEVWLDCDEARGLFDREDYSSVLLRPVDEAAAAALQQAIEGDKRLKMKAVREAGYYQQQTQTATPIRLLAYFLATAMSIGAVFAAMNTLYASVGARTREIGTLRVLGFPRRAILLGFMVEGALISAAGGVVGVLLSLFWNGYSTGTLSWESFNEIVFDFRITPVLALQGILFSVVVGVIGSFLPAVRAARLPVIAALKSV
jgi:putative ABC transport system permease protein